MYLCQLHFDWVFFFYGLCVFLFFIHFYLTSWTQIAGRIDADGRIQQHRFLCHLRHWDVAQSHRRGSAQLRRQRIQRFRRSHRHPQVCKYFPSPLLHIFAQIEYWFFLFLFFHLVWWKSFRASIGSKGTTAAVRACLFCERSVSCAFWSWSASCPTCAANWSSCCAPWTTWPSSSPCSFSSFSYSGTILTFSGPVLLKDKIIFAAPRVVCLRVVSHLPPSLSLYEPHKSSLCISTCVQTTCTITGQDPPRNVHTSKERERERSFGLLFISRPGSRYSSARFSHVSIRFHCSPP